MKTQKVTLLKKKLGQTNYASLLATLSTGEDNIFWELGNTKNVLKTLISSEDVGLLERFFAAAILRYHEAEIDKKYTKKLGEVYVYALENTNPEAENYIGIHGNSWGFLFHDNSVGELGKVLINYGEEAVLYLEKLLDDEGKIFYFGSQDATLGNTLKYRIKDVAAFYISKIKDIPITFYQDFEKRDAEINRLQEILDNE